VPRLSRGPGKQYQKLEAILMSTKRAENLRNTSKQRSGLGSFCDFIHTLIDKRAQVPIFHKCVDRFAK
jgi:hypothetical protein